MKEITAIIRMNKVQKTLDALSECGYPSFTVEKVMGRGKQKGLCYEFDPPLPEQEEPNLSHVPFVPKRLFTVVVDDRAADRIVQKIIKVNQTGHAGDGKVFVTDIPEAYRVRTGESGEMTVGRDME
ncbi:P-II family nitrogen regulator [Methanolobus sp. WCC5]|uniref:P-II family nitrogen regulator n=1 Tax=Methanolobus sp. WCC5 TaxID=3125785 RepID=UPI00324466B0